MPSPYSSYSISVPQGTLFHSTIIGLIFLYIKYLVPYFSIINICTSYSKIIPIPQLLSRVPYLRKFYIRAPYSPNEISFPAIRKYQSCNYTIPKQQTDACVTICARRSDAIAVGAPPREGTVSIALSSGKGQRSENIHIISYASFIMLRIFSYMWYIT